MRQGRTKYDNPIREERPHHAQVCNCRPCVAWRTADRKTRDMCEPPKSGRLAIDTMARPLKPPGGRA